MKTIIGILCLVLSVNVFALKIGFINIEKILDSSQSLQKQQQELDSAFKSKEKEFQARAAKIKELIEEYQNIEDELTDKEKEERLKFIADSEQSLKNEADIAQREFNGFRQEGLAKFETQLNNIIVEFSEKNKFDIILYKDVAYVSKDVDITDQIVKLIK